MTTIDPRASPCRAHPCSAEHSEIVLGYRALVDQWERVAEAMTGGYAAELEQHRHDHPRPLFRDWLRHNKRRPR